MATATMTMKNPRTLAMLVPREHGAWGMLLVPYATGAIVALHSGANTNSLAVFLLAALALFWLRTPVEAWLGTSPVKASSSHERKLVVIAALALASVAAIAVVELILAGYSQGVLAIGAVAALSFGLQAVVKRAGRRGRIPAQIIGAIGLTSTSAAAYYVGTGRLDRAAVALWLANFLFAGNQVHFVQLRIHSARLTAPTEKLRKGSAFLAGQLALLFGVALIGWVGILPKFAFVAFIPATVRGIGWFFASPKPLDVHRLGLSELFQSLIFGSLLCAVFIA
jgi:YwiC-like protein